MSAVESRRPLRARPALTLAEALPGKGVSVAPSKSHAEIEQEHADWRDAQPCATSCECGGFSFVGTVGEARAAFAEHLAEAHPERVGKKRQRNRGAFEHANGTVGGRAATATVEQSAAAAVAVEQREEQKMDDPSNEGFTCDDCDRRFVTAQAPVELAREIVQTSEDITNLEAELIGKYARLGELSVALAQIGTKQAA